MDQEDWSHLLIWVNCPIDNGNVTEMAASYQAAMAVFKKLCPKGARVADIAGIRKKGKYKCAWRVRYLRNGHDEIDPFLLPITICNSKPNNTEIVNKSRTFPPALEYDYSIMCTCKISPNAGMCTKRGVDEIKTEFVNLKVEENTQN